MGPGQSSWALSECIVSRILPGVGASDHLPGGHSRTSLHTSRHRPHLWEEDILCLLSPPPPPGGMGRPCIITRLLSLDPPQGLNCPAWRFEGWIFPAVTGGSDIMENSPMSVSCSVNVQRTSGSPGSLTGQRFPGVSHRKLNMKSCWLVNLIPAPRGLPWGPPLDSLLILFYEFIGATLVNEMM